MKKLHILIAVFCFTIFSIQSTYAQSENKNFEEKVYKISKTKTPQKVKEALKDYSGYKINEQATYTKKSKGNVYRFKVEKGSWSHYLLIHENGKIIGIETGEHSSS